MDAPTVCDLHEQAFTRGSPKLPARVSVAGYGIIAPGPVFVRNGTYFGACMTVESREGEAGGVLIQ